MYQYDRARLMFADATDMAFHVCAPACRTWCPGDWAYRQDGTSLAGNGDGFRRRNADDVASAHFTGTHKRRTHKRQCMRHPRDLEDADIEGNVCATRLHGYALAQHIKPTSDDLL